LLVTRQPALDADADPTATIVTLALNRPQARNAFNKALVQALHEALASLRHDPSVRMVLLKSSSPGGVFCAGADLKERATMPAADVAAFVAQLRSLMDSVEALPMPTVAVLEGAAFGGGLELALACDIRLAGPQAQMALTETSLAIIPGAGGTQRLPRLVGEAKAKELIFRAKRLGAKEAVTYGLVHHMYESGPALEAETQALCREIATNGPLAVRLAKKAVQEGMQVDLKRGLEVEKECYAQVIPTQDRLEGLAAFKEKRKPVYKGN
jgi:methylglutaconyl-CoA hydratase